MKFIINIPTNTKFNEVHEKSLRITFHAPKRLLAMWGGAGGCLECVCLSYELYRDRTPECQ